jgi:hypothetical protein
MRVLQRTPFAMVLARMKVCRSRQRCTAAAPAAARVWLSFCGLYFVQFSIAHTSQRTCLCQHSDRRMRIAFKWLGGHHITPVGDNTLA